MERQRGPFTGSAARERPDDAAALSGTLVATTPAVKVRMTRHYEGPNQDLYAAATAEARTIAGLTPSARLLPRTGTSPGRSDLRATADTTPYSTRDGRLS